MAGQRSGSAGRCRRATQVDGSGTVTVRNSKTDQEGRGHVRYLGAPTMQRLAAWLSGAGSTAGGPLFRQVLKDGATVTGRLGARSIRSIIAKRAAAAGVATRRRAKLRYQAGR